MGKVIKRVRLVSPSAMYSAVTSERKACAAEAVKQFPIELSFGSLSSSSPSEIWSPVEEGASPEARIKELKEAFDAKDIDALWCSRGGHLVINIARELRNYKPKNPKPIFGMSDNTLILAWLYAKTGCSGFHAPVFTDLIRDPGDRTLLSLRRVFEGDNKWSLAPSPCWRDWLPDLKNPYVKNEGPIILQEGEIESEYIVGHLSRLVYAQMLGWLPSLKNKVLFIEKPNTHPSEFSSDLEALLSLPGAEKINGLCIGRFANSPKLTREVLQKIIESKEELRGKPVVANLDFGHTYPIETLPFVGKAKLIARKDKFVLEGTTL